MYVMMTAKMTIEAVVSGQLSNLPNPSSADILHPHPRQTFHALAVCSLAAPAFHITRLLQHKHFYSNNCGIRVETCCGANCCFQSHWCEVGGKPPLAPALRLDASVPALLTCVCGLALRLGVSWTDCWIDCCYT